MDPRDNPLAEDLDAILAKTEPLWADVRGERLFVTGGTGFFGAWLLESFCWVSRRLDLKASATVLTRDPEGFSGRMPHLASDPAVSLWRGDVRDFDFPAGEFSHVVHAAATRAAATFQGEDPVRKFDTVAGGTRRALEFAGRAKAKRLLLTSSGAVYGRQPPEVGRISEDVRPALDPMDPACALGLGKLVAEFLCCRAASATGLEAKIARCFSFVGPHLQLDLHYAVGNFIRDGLAGGPIRVEGDGTPRRSYLYAADLCVWLWTILFRGRSGVAYNVGSEHDVSIGELADEVARAFEPQPVVSVGRASRSSTDSYVPCTLRAVGELGLSESTTLAQALRRTIHWHRQNGHAQVS